MPTSVHCRRRLQLHCSLRQPMQIPTVFPRLRGRLPSPSHILRSDRDLLVASHREAFSGKLIFSFSKLCKW